MTISKETNICISELKKEDSFPVSVFPKLIREIINETKATLNYPTDFIASAICFTLSVGIGNNLVAKVKEGWNERAILYMAIIGRSGVNKSHPLSFAMQPLFELDIKSSVKYQKERREYEKYILACKNFNRYNSGSEEQFWLSVFSGKPIILDRQGNKNSAFIKHSFISVIGTIQKRTTQRTGERGKE